MRKLFQEARVGGLHLKNRVVMAPMCTYEAKNQDGMITEFHKVHYGARAIGGVSLINIEATAIEERGRIHVNDLGLWNPQQAEKLKELVDILHNLGSKVGVQLAHAGRKARGPKEIISASELAFNKEYLTPKAMTEEEIIKTIDKFIASAKFAKEAGVDMIEIHAAHGYLLNQFLSPLVNQRTDQYGGEISQRFLFLKKVIIGIRNIFDGALWVRISSKEYDEAGITQKEIIMISHWMKELGVDLIDVSSGGVIDKFPENLYPGYQVADGTQIKEKVGISVAVVGLLSDANLCEYILQNHQADLICLGRPLLKNPNWILQAAEELRAKEEVKAYNVSYERGRN